MQPFRARPIACSPTSDTRCPRRERAGPRPSRNHRRGCGNACSDTTSISVACVCCLTCSPSTGSSSRARDDTTVGGLGLTFSRERLATRHVPPVSCGEAAGRDDEGPSPLVDHLAHAETIRTRVSVFNAIIEVGPNASRPVGRASRAGRDSDIWCGVPSLRQDESGLFPPTRNGIIGVARTRYDPPSGRKAAGRNSDGPCYPRRQAVLRQARTV